MPGPRLHVLTLVAAALAALPAWAQPLTLDASVRLALDKNERARSAGASVEVSQARVARARSFFFPELTATGSYTRRAGDSSFQELNALSADLTLSWTLFDARSIPLYRAARHDLEAARAGALAERRRLTFEAGEAFMQTLGAQQVMAAAERRRELAVQGRDDARARQAAGLVRSNDVTRAELELAEAERELIRSRGELATARLQLGYLLGVRAPEALAEPPEALFATATANPAIAEAERRRADVVRARRLADAAVETAKEPRRRWWPTLAVRGDAGVSNETGISGRNFDWSIGLQLGWQIFDGGERYAEGRERDALAEIARLEAVALERRVRLDVEIAVVAVEDRRAGVEQAGIAVEVARKNATEAAALYRQGLATALELSDANLRLFEAEVAVVRERYALGIAVLDLYAALGLDALGRDRT